MDDKTREVLRECNAIIINDHFVYTSGRHGDAYVNKDAIYPFPLKTSYLCKRFAEHFRMFEIDCVIGPEKGGIILAQWTAFHLSEIQQKVVNAVFAEKEGEEFVIRRGQDKFVRGRKLLIVEDILTTGGSVTKVIKLVRDTDGNVVAVGAICNRGGVTPETIGTPHLVSLIDVKLDSWSEEECMESGPCSKGIPVNTEIGKGKEFLARKGKV